MVFGLSAVSLWSGIRAVVGVVALCRQVVESAWRHAARHRLVGSSLSRPPMRISKGPIGRSEPVRCL
jgi:hypothetical protein